MELKKLGRSGLDVSPVILGAMSYGEPGRGPHPWSLAPAESKPFFKQALELGITTWDTANMYSDGSSEEIVGTMVRELTRREDVVIATKVYMPMRPGRPNGGGLSRAAIMTEVDASLRRLGTDYIDLYQIHRWDPSVPIEETMEALHDVVKAGKARYIGASSMWAWQFAKAQHVAESRGWTKFVSMQDQYSLISREEEREMHPLCVDQGVGVIPWSPLARGKLTRPWGESTNRTETDLVSQALYKQAEDSDHAIVDAVGAIAEERGVPRAQVALAWVIGKSAVTAPIVGATKPHHLSDAAAALNLALTVEEVERLEAPYAPRQPEGFQ
jgi:aryl-alcohol dehydrogenase (NADP+)